MAVDSCSGFYSIVNLETENSNQFAHGFVGRQWFHLFYIETLTHSEDLAMLLSLIFFGEFTMNVSELLNWKISKKIVILFQIGSKSCYADKKIESKKSTARFSEHSNWQWSIGQSLVFWQLFCRFPRISNSFLFSWSLLSSSFSLSRSLSLSLTPSLMFSILCEAATINNVRQTSIQQTIWPTNDFIQWVTVCNQEKWWCERAAGQARVRSVQSEINQT